MQCVVSIEGGKSESRVSGHVHEASSRCVLTARMARGCGPDRLQLPAWGECLKKVGVWVRGVGHNLSCSPLGPGRMADCSQSLFLQVEFLQLLQREHPLQLFDDEADG